MELAGTEWHSSMSQTTPPKPGTELVGHHAAEAAQDCGRGTSTGHQSQANPLKALHPSVLHK